MQANLGSLHYYTHRPVYTYTPPGAFSKLQPKHDSTLGQFYLPTISSKKIPHHTTTYKNSSNYYVKKARSSHLQTKKKQDQIFFSSFYPLLRTERRHHSPRYPQTRPHVTKGRQVGRFSRPETDDADVINIKFVLVDEFQ
jgi:hypothetical protein